MNLSDDQIIEKKWKKSRHCNRKTLLPYEYEFTCLQLGDSTQLKENVNSLNYNEIKLIILID